VRLTNFAVDRSTTIIVLLFIISIAGIYSYIVLPRESNPEIVVPFINVTVAYEGVTPEDMESLVTVPIERKLTGLSDVKEITSTSLEGVSTLTIEFQPDTIIEEALQRVRDKVDLAKSDLPDDADDPIINEINLSEIPIMLMSLTGSAGLPLLNEIADELEDRIEAIPGVLDVQVIGGVEREIQIEVDPDRVAEYGIPLVDLVEVTRLENVNTPGGSMNLGEAKFLMRTPGEIRSPEELANLVVRTGPEGTVYLRDIANIKDAFKELDSLSRVDGEPAITLAISKRSGENIIRIADQVNILFDQLQDELPQGMEIALTWDESVFVRDMVNELENSILSGLILVLAVIFIFLGFTNALFVALAIPVSMLITFFVLHMSGVTLNMVVLFSLTLALGMLVDNGIVVVENIYRHMQMGYDRVSASKLGVDEVAWPIIGSTLTTVAAFTPMFFWPGIWGKFMVYLPLTVTLALVSSLFVGLVVNPALAGRFMRIKASAKRDGRAERHPVLHAYAMLLQQSIRWRAITVTVAVMGLIVITYEFVTHAEFEFTPTIEPPQADIDIKCPEGTNLATSDSYVRLVENVLEPYRDNLEHVIANIGSQGVSLYGENRANTTHLSRVTLDFPKLEDCTVMPSAIVEQVREDLAGIMGAEVRIEKMSMGPPTGPPINIEISGDDFDTLAQLAKDIRAHIKDVPSLVDLRDDYNKGKPEVRVVVDRQQAWNTGLNTSLIGITVQTAVDGRKAGDYREGDEEYDVVVRFPKEFREDLSNIEAMKLINLRGEAIPMSVVAHVEQGSGLGSITRIDRRRTVTVSADIETGALGQEVLNDVRKAMTDFPMPAGYTVDYTGENEDTEETEAFLKRAFVAAVLLITFVLVAQFNSVLQPLVIVSSVVLSLAGVFLGLFLFDMPFGILMTGIGVISLAGVVVNNAIVLIDFINQLRARGLALEEAVIEAGMKRFRPVMLTAITTILGLIPMALGVSFNFREFRWTFGGETSQFWGSMAVAVIFGLAFATILTLIVVPTLYTFTASLAEILPAKTDDEQVPAVEASAK
jgi:CzcA family heavy metal efflux pump